MKLVSFAAAALAVVTLGAAPRPVPLIVYSAPAGDRPAGADAIAPATAILPNGRIASPSGRSAFVGTNPSGVALTPDGRFAIVSNGGSAGATAAGGASALIAGYSLAVVNAQTMALASVYHDPGAAFFMGVAATRDPADPTRTIVLASDVAHAAVRVFDLDASGTLQPESNAIALAAAPGRRAFPAGIAIAAGGRTAFVADNFGDDVAEIDVASRSVRRTIPAGDFPLAVTAGGGLVAVSAGGLSTYAAVEPPVAQPRFAPPAFDPFHSSSLFVFDASGGAAATDPTAVPLDPAPDGDKNVGGAAPGAMAIRRDGKLAYVALANVDRVAVVSLSGTPRVVRGLDLRLFPNAPYGAQPSAVALSADQKRLYVALAGLNAVAVLDARAPTRYRYGLIPTGWYPSAMALSPNGRFLYVACAKGVDGWGMLTRIDLKHTPLVKATMDTLRYTRVASVAKFNAVVPPLRSGKRSSAIDHVVYIAVGTQAYDAMLGDLRDTTGGGVGNGNPAYAQYPENVTPNLHALARTYALADNFYAADADAGIARLFATGGDASLYTQLTAPLRAVRAPFDGEGSDPENYARAGYLFNAFARAGLPFRDYGGLLQLSGFGDGLYHLDVPALAALNGNTDPNYSGDDAQRAQEFVRDMQRYADAGQVPSYVYVWLPTAQRPGGAGDADRALGAIVEYLSGIPSWSSTAIFIVPEGVAGVDHVNALRSYCIVVSPLARKGYVGRAHLSVPSVVKTEEEIFGLPPLGLNDLLSTDMADFFTDAPDPQPFHAIR